MAPQKSVGAPHKRQLGGSVLGWNLDSDKVRGSFAIEFLGERLCPYCLALALSEVSMRQVSLNGFSLPAFPVIAYLVLSGGCNRWSWLLLVPSNTMCHANFSQPFHLCRTADTLYSYTIQRVLESSEVLFLLAVKVPVSEKCIRSEITQI